MKWLWSEKPASAASRASSRRPPERAASSPTRGGASARTRQPSRRTRAGTRGRRAPGAFRPPSPSSASVGCAGLRSCRRSRAVRSQERVSRRRIDRAPPGSSQELKHEPLEREVRARIARLELAGDPPAERGGRRHPKVAAMGEGEPKRGLAFSSRARTASTWAPPAEKLLECASPAGSSARLPRESEAAVSRERLVESAVENRHEVVALGLDHTVPIVGRKDEPRHLVRPRDRPAIRPAVRARRRQTCRPHHP